MSKKSDKKKGDKKDIYPLACNILKLQQYNFEVLGTEGVVLFDWLVIKGKSFGFKEFYQSFRVIREETGIKRSVLNRLLELFTEWNIIKIEAKGMPKVHHFTVNFSELAKLKTLSKIYKNDKVRDLMPWFKDLAKNQKKYAATKKVRKEGDNQLHYSLDTLIIELNSTYNNRRTMLNESRKKEAETNEKEEVRLLSQSVLAINKVHKLKLSQLLDEYPIKSIKDSFSAYADKVLSDEEEEPTNMLSHFLSFDENKGEWSVFSYYLNHFNNNYSYSSTIY